MNPALRSFWSQPSRYKVLHGGRASSKSWDAAAQVVKVSSRVCVRVLCTRMFQNKIAESVYSLIKTQIERFGLAHLYEFTQNSITCTKTGSEFLFYGLARNIDEIKSLEGVDILWIEEAQALTSYMWEILEPTIRKEGSEIWVIFNPRLANDFAYKRFVVNPPRGALVRQINYNENPFLSSTMLDTIERAKTENPDDFAHIYLGEPRGDDDKTVIKRSWLQAAIDAHITLGIEPGGLRRIGFDIADDGGDLNATVEAQGILACEMSEWKGGENELLRSCMRVYSQAVLSGSEIDFDCIGVGASAGAKFNELNEAQGRAVVAHKFNAGGGVVNPEQLWQPGITNKEFFSNAKAQAWWVVAERLRKTYAWVANGEACDPSEIISISSTLDGIDALIDELSTPYKDFTPDGRVKVESKQDLAKRGVKSPNKADAFIMAYAPRQQAERGLWG